MNGFNNEWTDSIPIRPVYSEAYFISNTFQTAIFRRMCTALTM